MSNRWLRFGIALLAIGAAGAAGYRIYQQEQQLAADLLVARSAETAAESAIVTISELKAALHAYVAEGQGAAFWTARAATLIDRLRASLLELDPAATAAGASLTETLDLTDRVAAAEQRAREHLSNSERLLAGEVIFTEVRDQLDAMRLQVARAETVTAEAAGRAHGEVRRTEIMLALGAAGILAFAALLLVVPGTAAAPPVSPIPDGKSLGSRADQFESTARVVTRGPTAQEQVKQPAARSGPRITPTAQTAPRAPAAPSAPSAPSVSLRDAAAICTDLGRVSQSIEINGLLERAATVLNASGAIVWLASPDRTEMYPAASAGYDERLLARIGSIGRDAANVTAAAFRDASPRTSPSQGTSAAALAVPLMTPLGPVGVFSAELKLKEVAVVDETRLAVSTIFAAQLAALLGSMAEPATGEETAGESLPAAKVQA